jgi:hypothetical protein
MAANPYTINRMVKAFYHFSNTGWVKMDFLSLMSLKPLSRHSDNYH